MFSFAYPSVCLFVKGLQGSDLRLSWSTRSVSLADTSLSLKAYIRVRTIYEVAFYSQHGAMVGLHWVVQSCNSQTTGLCRLAARHDEGGKKYGEKGNSCLVPRSARKLPLPALCRSTGSCKLGLRMRILSPPGPIYDLSFDVPYLYPRSQRILFSCIISACASHLGIDLVEDPPNGSCDLAAHIQGQGDLDGETSPIFHAAQDEHFGGVPEDSGEDDGEVGLPERRHCGRLIPMANSRGLSGCDFVSAQTGSCVSLYL